MIEFFLCEQCQRAAAPPLGDSRGKSRRYPHLEGEAMWPPMKRGRHRRTHRVARIVHGPPCNFYIAYISWKKIKMSIN
jgi:hypothetical protein